MEQASSPKSHNLCAEAQGIQTPLYIFNNNSQKVIHLGSVLHLTSSHYRDFVKLLQTPQF